MLALLRCISNITSQHIRFVRICALIVGMLIFFSCTQEPPATRPPVGQCATPRESVTLRNDSVEITINCTKRSLRVAEETAVQAVFLHGSGADRQNTFLYTISGERVAGVSSGTYTLDANDTEHTVMFFVRETINDARIAISLYELIQGRAHLRGQQELLYRGSEVLAQPDTNEVPAGGVTEVTFLRRSGSSAVHFSIGISGGNIDGKQDVMLFTNGKNEQRFRISAERNSNRPRSALTISLKRNGVDTGAEIVIPVVNSDASVVDCPPIPQSQCAMQRAVSGEQARPTYRTPLQNSIINAADDEDWFSADIASGVVYEMLAHTQETGAPFSIAVSVIDRFSGRVLVENAIFDRTEKAIRFRTTTLRNRYWVQVKRAAGTGGRYAVMLRQIDPCAESVYEVERYYQLVANQDVRDYDGDSICELQVDKSQSGVFFPSDRAGTLDGNAYSVRLDPNTQYRLHIEWKDAAQKIQTQVGFYRSATAISNTDSNVPLILLSGVVLNADSALQRAKENNGIENIAPNRNGFLYTTSEYINAETPTLIQLLPNAQSQQAAEYSITIQKTSR